MMEQPSEGLFAGRPRESARVICDAVLLPSAPLYGNRRSSRHFGASLRTYIGGADYVPERTSCPVGCRGSQGCSTVAGEFTRWSLRSRVGEWLRRCHQTAGQPRRGGNRSGRGRSVSPGQPGNRDLRAAVARSAPRSDPGPEPLVRPGYREACRRSEEHTSELQSQSNLVCRLLLEKKTS